MRVMLQANSATLVRAGERAEFRIISRDQYGNVRSQGGDEFKVVVRMSEGPGKTEVQVRPPSPPRPSSPFLPTLPSPQPRIAATAQVDSIVPRHPCHPCVTPAIPHLRALHTHYRHRTERPWIRICQGSCCR